MGVILLLHCWRTCALLHYTPCTHTHLPHAAPTRLATHKPAAPHRMASGGREDICTVLPHHMGSPPHHPATSPPPFCLNLSPTSCIYHLISGRFAKHQHISLCFFCVRRKNLSWFWLFVTPPHLPPTTDSSSPRDTPQPALLDMDSRGVLPSFLCS